MNKKILTYVICFVLLIAVNACTNANNKELDITKESTVERESNESSEELIHYDIPEKEPVNEISNGVTSKGYKIENIDGITYVDGYLIANKTYSLPSTYIPEGTHIPLGDMDWCQECIIEEAYQEYARMRDDMQSLGMRVYIGSGYRGYYQQAGLYQMYVNSDGQAAADTYSARAGHSEHQTGYAFDICDYDYPGDCIEESYENTPSGKWINENAYRYGYIIRYPKGKTDETGYIYEAWHLRYVGEELARKLYNNGDWITMEDYFGITSAYQD